MISYKVVPNMYWLVGILLLVALLILVTVSLFVSGCFLPEEVLLFSSILQGFWFCLFIKKMLIARKHVLFLSNLEKRTEQIASFNNGNRLLGKISNALLHDIATPVSVLSGSYHLLKNGDLSEREQKDIKQSISTSLQEIETILHSTDFLMHSTHRKEEFSVAESIRSLLTIVDSRLKKSCITLEIQLDDDITILGEKNTFQRVFLNVLLNAIEELETCKRKKKIIGVKTTVGGRYITIDLWDNGNGFDSNGIIDIEKCFIISGKTSCIGSGLAFVKYAMKEVFNGFLSVHWDKIERINTVSLHFDKGF